MRNLEAMRQRRAQAGRMFDHGAGQSEVAAKPRVSKQSASRWHHAWERGGTTALAAQARPGPRLSDAQPAEVEKALLKGPRAHGYVTDLWTLARIAAVIEKATGVSYSLTQTWTILRERLGWSRQRPARRARERDEAAIADRVAADWPRIKKSPTTVGPGSASPTNPGSPRSRR
ncbi:winged helix-turn-helix domain-containing protein [Nocardia brevicatena]|uniref:winged helix-turn-helix domain-containing protein n=1 Tax=Nocardia brevicatena TaxID=37327 RepID=UPI00030E93F4|nr:winged helix-turn-helix domain-containing protein [Nocardia brevicatena]